jgi:hypothetical protein
MSVLTYLEQPDLYKKLHVLTESEVGFGILEENDAGTVSPTLDLNEGLVKEMQEHLMDYSKPVYVYATLQKYGTENRNGRIYPEEILRREVEKYQKVIAMNASFHELDHPESSIVSLTKGSPHRVVEMLWRDNVLIGKLEILVSRGFREHGGLYCGGDMMAHYLSYGMTLGISSRGVGTLKTVNGKKLVQPDFELICFDVVSSPSTPGSYIYHNIEDFAKFDEKIVKPSAQTPRNPREDRQEALMQRLNQFLGTQNNRY